MLTQFKTHITTQFPFLLQSKLVVAVSGGLDSVVLSHLCHHLGLNITLAHCNFKLRDAESDADAQFVADLAEQLQVKIRSKVFDTKTYMKTHKVSLQMAAREQRYQWFYQLIAQQHFDYVLTAHHANDNLETVLINFLRGTGLNGLTGIPKINTRTVRPLLPFSRQQIYNYAQAEHIVWRNDSSNTSRKYLRNKLRHDVVPVLEETTPQLLSNVKHTLAHLKDAEVIVNDAIHQFKAKAIVKTTPTETLFSVNAFITLQQPKAYLYYVFYTYGFTAWKDVLALLKAETGKFVTSATHKLTKHSDYLILSHLKHQVDYFEAKVDALNIPVHTPIGQFMVQSVSEVKTNTKHTIYIPAKSLQLPLKIRTWQAGDTFAPLGMRGTKKVSKFLKDLKLTPQEKAETLVVLSNNVIVWVIGYRASALPKIAPNTARFLKLSVH